MTGTPITKLDAIISASLAKHPASIGDAAREMTNALLLDGLALWCLWQRFPFSKPEGAVMAALRRELRCGETASPRSGVNRDADTSGDVGEFPRAGDGDPDSAHSTYPSGPATGQGVAIRQAPKTANIDLPPPTLSTLAATATRMAAATSPLRLIQVNGRALADVTVEEALRWAEKRGIEARAISFMCAGQPPTARVGQVVTDAEAEAVYKRAGNQ